MFGEQGRPARQIAMRALMNTKMVEETPMRDPFLKMFNHLNTLEILGGEILKSLPDSFNQFKLNYIMNKIDFALSELLNALQAAESIIKGHPSVNNMKKLHFSCLFPREMANEKK